MVLAAGFEPAVYPLREDRFPKQTAPAKMVARDGTAPPLRICKNRLSLFDLQAKFNSWESRPFRYRPVDVSLTVGLFHRGSLELNLIAGRLAVSKQPHRTSTRPDKPILNYYRIVEEEAWI